MCVLKARRMSPIFLLLLTIRAFAAVPEVRARGLGDFLSKQGYVAVPLQRLGRDLVVQVRTGDNKLLLGLDTGAWQTALPHHHPRDDPEGRAAMAVLRCHGG